MNKTCGLILLFILSGLNLQCQSFPTFRVTAYDTTSSGYYFFCPYVFGSSGSLPPGTQYKMILNNKGQLVYFKNVSGTSTGDFKLHTSGLITYSANMKFYLMDSTFTVVDSVSSRNGIMPDMHDLQILPNGHFLILGMENIQSDLSSYNMFLGNGTPGSANATVKAGVIQELDANKNVVFEWHSIDYFNFDDVDEFFLNNPANIDWTHFNAVELDTDGNILVSSRHFNEITKISRADSTIIWRFGGKRNQFTFIGDSIQFLSQHDVRRISNGNITLFDNGRFLNPIHPAAAKEYYLDETGMTATLVWTYREGNLIYSRSQGNVQRLLNGNTLTSYGDLRSANIVFNVVDSIGSKVFEIAFPDSLITYRTFNYPALPWTLQRPAIFCVNLSGQFVLEADSGHSSYLWSTGATTQSIVLSDTGIYSVFVPYGEGGFLSSDNFVVSDLVNPCFTVSVHELVDKHGLFFFPNPVQSHLTIQFPQQKNHSGTLEIFDMTGICVGKFEEHENLTEFSIDLSQLSPGTYFLRIGEYHGRFVKM